MYLTCLPQHSTNHLNIQPTTRYENEYLKFIVYSLLTNQLGIDITACPVVFYCQHSIEHSVGMYEKYVGFLSITN